MSNYLKPLNFDLDNKVDYIGYSLLIIGGLVLIASLYRNVQTLQKIAVVREEVSNIETSKSLINNINHQADSPEAKAIFEKIAKQARYPWNQIFSTLETIHTKHVSLMAVQPDFEKGQAWISAEADDMHQVLEYIKVFEHQEGIDHVELLSQELVLNNQKERISFDIMVKFL